MKFNQQFKIFDPLSCAIPDKSSPYLSEIATRARALLKSRDLPQIELAAMDMDWLIAKYFRESRKEAVLSIQTNVGDEILDFFFVCDSKKIEDGRWRFKDVIQNKFDINTSRITGEIGALKNCIDWWVETEKVDFNGLKKYEFFAVLSLWMIADAIYWFQYRTANTMNVLLSAIETLYEDIEAASIHGVAPTINHQNTRIEFNLYLDAEYTLKALDAVCYAEQLHELELLKQEQSTNLLNIQNHNLLVGQNRQSITAEPLNTDHLCKQADAQELVVALNNIISAFSGERKTTLNYADWIKPKGFLRLKQIIGDPNAKPPIPAIIPVCKSTWWEGVKSGRYPQPDRSLGRRITAWRAEDIYALTIS